MRRTLSAAVLVLALCCPVSAGVIHNPPPEPPPVPAESAAPETTGAETDAPGLSDSLAEMTFELLALLPALL